MMGFVLGAGLTLVATAQANSDAPSWTCAYASHRLPRTLRLLGHDALSPLETAATRERLHLGDTLLTRASALTLASAMGATKMLLVGCRSDRGGKDVVFEGRLYDVVSPQADPPVRVVRSADQIQRAIDDFAKAAIGFSSPGPPDAPLLAAALVAKVGVALSAANSAERAKELREAARLEPASPELRELTAESLFAARDFDSVIGLALANPSKGAETGRALRFLGGAAELEAGRYSEAFDTFERLRTVRETEEVLNNLGVARFRMRYKDASDYFERAAKLSGARRRDVDFNRSLALIFEGNSEAAADRLQAALVQDPTDTRSRLLRVWALRTLGRGVEREEEWQRLMEIAPSFVSLAAPDLARRLERIFVAEHSPLP